MKERSLAIASVPVQEWGSLYTDAEALERTKETLDSRNFYYCNPEIDKGVCKKEAR